jgi:hypothetical protein
MGETRMKGKAKRATLLRDSLEEKQQGSFETSVHGPRPKWVGYFTGAINVDLILKVLPSE